jgi:hypothetical protein
VSAIEVAAGPSQYLVVQSMLRKISDENFGVLVSKLSSSSDRKIPPKKIKLLLQQLKLSTKNADAVIACMLKELSDDSGKTVSEEEFTLYARASSNVSAVKIGLMKQRDTKDRKTNSLVESARLIVQRKTKDRKSLKAVFGKLTSDSSVGMTKQEFKKFVTVLHKQASQEYPSRDVLEQMWKIVTSLNGATAVAIDVGTLSTWLFGKGSSGKTGKTGNVNGAGRKQSAAASSKSTTNPTPQAQANRKKMRSGNF